MLELLPVVWSFCKTWWKVILPVVLLLMALAYVEVLHLEISHYKTQVIALETEKEAVHAKNVLLEQSATDLSKKYARQLENKLLDQQKQVKLVQERIKNDKESRGIPISSNVVELFNASKPDSESVAPTKQGNDGTTGTNQKTLNDLLLVTAGNDAAHEVCIRTVEEWQHFWIDYKTSVEAISK